ncbi:hypothetical protein CKA32_001036 [Geitlerinema sp. FC II]|nr:hypothetical protein CKA32_001036 [Geitlerinema sp. FC II]
MSPSGVEALKFGFRIRYAIALNPGIVKIAKVDRNNARERKSL